jgi:hypothetical protein
MFIIHQIFFCHKQPRKTQYASGVFEFQQFFGLLSKNICFLRPKPLLNHGYVKSSTD